MDRLKFGVIGVGHMGQNHVRNVADESRYFDLVGIYDNNFEHAKRIAAQFHTEAYGDLDELLENVDAVSVVVPSSLHLEIGLKVAEHGVHALIEKPLALTSGDAAVLMEAFANKNLKLQVGHIERFNPVMTELDKILERNKVFFVEAHRYGPFSGSGRITDASVVEDLMIHDVDLVCHLMGADVIDIRANGERIRSDNIDFATSMLEFNDNAHAIISASRVSQGKERTIEVHTEDSYIQADLLTKSLTISKNTDIVLDGSGDSSYKQDGMVQKIFVPIKEPLRQELLSFYESVMNDAPVAVTGEDGMKAVKICEDILNRIKNK